METEKDNLVKNISFLRKLTDDMNTQLYEIFEKERNSIGFQPIGPLLSISNVPPLEVHAIYVGGTMELINNTATSFLLTMPLYDVAIPWSKDQNPKEAILNWAKEELLKEEVDYS